MKNKLKPILGLITLILIAASSVSQGQGKKLNNFYGNSAESGDICIRAGNFSSDMDVERLVNQILDKYGIQNRFSIVPCDRTSNAQAILDERGRPYILYNPNFLMRVKKLNFTTATLPGTTAQDWESLMVLAHEIGHHLNYHLLSPHPDATIRSMELEADETAGHILYLLGASLTDAQRVLYSSLVPMEGSMTHPPRAQRLEAVERGYRGAEKKFSNNPVAVNEPPGPSNRGSQPLVADDEDLVRFNMVFVKGGTFLMGSKMGFNTQIDEMPQHSVTLSDFQIGKYEVTNKQWKEVMGSDPPVLGSEFDHFRDCDNCPVVGVSIYDVDKFIRRINEKTGKKYRLPTESEWEYAASGGGQSEGYRYSGSNNIDDVAWYKINSGDGPKQVGQKKPNELGLYDMTGNALEWCQDGYSFYNKAPKIDPIGHGSGSENIIRGCSWADRPKGTLCSNTARGFLKTGESKTFIGFRLVRE